MTMKSMKLVVVIAATAFAMSVLAAPPQRCRPNEAESDRIKQAQSVFKPGEPLAALKIWDDLLLESAKSGVSCKSVEIAWRAGDFLKRQKNSEDLALKYLNKGNAAYVKGVPAEDYSLAKVFKTTGHVFKRKGDLVRACQSLNSALKILVSLKDTSEIDQTKSEMGEFDCKKDPTIN